MKKKQHFVPQCYLKNFAAQGKKIFVFDKINSKSYSANIKDISQESYFNDFPDAFLPEELRDQEKSQVIEDELSKVETRFGEFLKLIISVLEKIEKNNLFDSLGVLDQAAKKNFSAFLTLQFARTKKAREQNRSILQDLDALIKKWNQVLPNHDNIPKWDFPKPAGGAYSIKLEYGEDLLKVGIEEDSIAQHLIWISDIIVQVHDSEIYKTLSNHIWLFGINSTSIPLWTSDNPIVINNPIVIKKHEDLGIGLASKGVQVVYPISPKYLLIMFEPSFWSELKHLDGMSAILSENYVKLYNQLQLTQCYRQTYSNENNFEQLC